MKQKLNNQSLGSSYWIFSFLALSLTLSLTVFLAFWGVAPGKAADLSYEPLFVTGGGGGGASGGGGGGGAGGGGGQGGSGAGGDGSSNLGTSGAHGGSGGGGGGGGGAANDDPSHRPDNGENGKDATTSQGGTNAAGGHEGFGAGNGDPGDGSSDNLAAGGAPNSGYTTGGDGASGGDGGDGGDGSDVVNGATGTGFNGGAGGGSTGINTGAGGSGSGTSGSGGTGGGVNSNGDDGGDGDNGPNGQPGKTGDDGDPAGAQTGSGWTATVTPPSATYDFITLKSASGGEGGKGGSGGDAGADGGDGGDGAKAADRSTYTGGNGGSGGAGGKGGAGGAGGAGGDGGTQLDIDIRVNGTFEALTITGRSELIAGDGGQGAAGGASGHDNPSATNIGGIGGDGGDGGSGADIFLTFLKDPTKSNTVITFKDIFNAIAGSGLKGGAGGEKFSATSQGGAGGDSLTGGSVSVDFQTDFVVFERNATLTAGDGGDGGEGGANSGGQGGKGGDGGAVTLTAIDAILNGAHLAVTSGTAGSDGTLNTFGVGGAGGAAQVTISHDLLALKDSDLNFTIGDTLGTNPGGNLNFTVDRRLYIASSQAVRLNITGTMNPGDDAVSFSTLYLEPNSSLTTSSSVYSYINPGTTSYYQVNSLDVITQGSWSTAGVFAPDNINSPYNDYIRFDLSDISPNDTILTFSGSTGAINLQDFNPIAQQNAYLSSPGWSKYSDVPGILEYRRDELAPAFITGVYQTKPLDLGLLTLADRTTGVLNPLVSELRADGNFHYISQGVNYHVDPLYDDFAFTAGLRRYYFDVFVDASDPNLPLKARNYHTADATKIYYQGAGAALVSANQTLEVTLNALDKIARNSPSDRLSLAAVFGGSHAKVKTGSHVKVDNLTAALLLAKKTELSFGQITVGAFGEFGRGNYDAYSYIPRYGEIFGDGDVDTYGGGLYFKAKFKQNTFVELSVRGGGASNEFKVNKDPWLLHPENHSYETDNAYYGAHFGLGHTFTLGEKTSLDGYGRYFWTRSDGDKFETRLGDKITLDAVDSQRARVGARLNHSFLEDKVNFYVGAAAEREFDGEINGHLNRDRPTDVPELKGTSGFGEIGISLKPTDSQNFVINAEAFGWAGNQEGVGGTLALSFNF